VLVVDDNEDAAESLALMLQAYGHEVVEVVHDGKTALEAVLSKKPGIVLLDIGLPGMDGYDVARHIRKQIDAQTLRIIAVTGYGLESDRQRSREAGFDYHMVKPVDPERLQEVLSALAPATQAG
jgi:CheY-like chemotaxis protein